MTASYDLKFDNGALQVSLFGRNGALTEFLESYARDVVNQAKANVTSMRAVRTGNLRRSIHAEPIEIGAGKAEVSVVADAHYASYVHDGHPTPLQYIYPRKARALRFMVGQKVVFASRVRAQHNPRPFLRMAAEEVAARMLT